MGGPGVPEGSGMSQSLGIPEKMGICEAGMYLEVQGLSARSRLFFNVEVATNISTQERLRLRLLKGLRANTNSWS